MPVDIPAEDFRALGYQAVDIVTRHLQGLQSRADGEVSLTRKAVPDELKHKLMMADLPDEPVGDTSALLAAFERDVVGYPMGNGSAKFFGWVNSPPAPVGILADFLASGMNPSVAGGDHSATYVEHGVLKWMKEMLGYPSTSAGVLVSGGSVANIVCLAAMRFKMGGGTELRQKGFLGLAREGGEWSKPMVVYTSTEGHSCIQKAIELLGIGSSYLRKIPTVPGTFQLSIPHLLTQIESDRCDGLRPVCVAASAGTVNTGAIDDLDQLANVCEKEGMWFHVDGSFGAAGVLVDELKHLYKGMERADSLAVDQHKWLYVPIDCGCALVKDPLVLRQSFSLLPPYLLSDRSLPWFSEFTIEQTRPFRAAKLWLAIQSLGRNGYAEYIGRDIRMARELRNRIRNRGRVLEVVAEGPLSVTCFRYIPASGDREPALEQLNQLQDTIADLLQKDGRCFLTPTTFPVESLEAQVASLNMGSSDVAESTGVKVKALRACIVNYRVTEEDLDTLLAVVCECGEVAWKGMGATSR
ncbi:PLP-dependent transferase [Gonapodya prolifera JEL478]|uniref:PLP-dependent transferase n=1 Tax=Gonapodya prolifera (strain JEL478) TaxID=1344416 RepID=A0A139A788_GONPJ|nr:PLP-dependent transferase [Gonapodya prolifera JEL478]|eukprot:KXS12325.1 PLP-dependent transferase [Gonapodya prolifera JEL478]